MPELEGTATTATLNSFFPVMIQPKKSTAQCIKHLDIMQPFFNNQPRNGSAVFSDRQLQGYSHICASE